MAALTSKDAYRIESDITNWLKETKYQATEQDSVVMKAAIVDSIRSTIIKSAAGTGLGVLVGAALPSISKVKIPIGGFATMGLLLGIAVDRATNTRDFIYNWVRLQESINSPLSERLNKTTASISPLSDAGNIARAWIGKHENAAMPSAELLPSELPSPLPSPSPSPSLVNTGRQHHAPLSTKRPGSGFYDVTTTNRQSSTPSDNPHPIPAAGTGYYDVTSAGTRTVRASGHIPSVQTRPPRYRAVEPEEGTAPEGSSKPPVRPTRVPVFPPTNSTSNQVDTPQNSSTKPSKNLVPAAGGITRVNKYGDEVLL